MTRTRHALFDLFDHIIVSGEVGLIKPDREIFELTLRQIDRKPSACIFIDDNDENVRAAESMGFATVHFRSPQQLADALRSLGVQ
jgi:HAD superfamily hydrolase (TIGR01509 family)